MGGGHTGQLIHDHYLVDGGDLLRILGFRLLGTRGLWGKQTDRQTDCNMEMIQNRRQLIQLVATTVPPIGCLSIIIDESRSGGTHGAALQAAPAQISLGSCLE